MTMKFATTTILSRKVGASLAALLIAWPLLYAQRQQQGQRTEPAPRSEPAPRTQPSRAPVQHTQPVFVDRTNHGSVRHVDTHIVEQPGRRPIEGTHDFYLHNDVNRHPAVDVDFH